MDDNNIIIMLLIMTVIVTGEREKEDACVLCECANVYRDVRKKKCI